MKTRLLYLFLLLTLLTVSVSQAQTATADAGNPIKELRAALQSLDTGPARLPTGVLLNRMMFITNPHRFAGQGDTTVSYAGFEQQYWEY